MRSYQEIEKERQELIDLKNCLNVVFLEKRGIISQNHLEIIQSLNKKKDNLIYPEKALIKPNIPKYYHTSFLAICVSISLPMMISLLYSLDHLLFRIFITELDSRLVLFFLIFSCFIGITCGNLLSSSFGRDLNKYYRDLNNRLTQKEKENLLIIIDEEIHNLEQMTLTEESRLYNEFLELKQKTLTNLEAEEKELVEKLSLGILGKSLQEEK